MHEPWERFRIDVEQIEDEGEGAVGAIRFRAKGVDSGVEVDMRFSNAIRVRDGLATKLANRRTPEEALEAVRGDDAEAKRPARREGERARS
jgi:ketosteroid isomerase-like protein